MNELIFHKISCDKGKENLIVIFEQGCFHTPICILSENEINDLNKEWVKK